ncbi:hypothetical protein B2J88_11960 [Rhodococcus sp. SRB_17]|uniref:hypothetical protein n=1 Tax=Acidovorax sp. SRB_24 TaxID=1962700 RepID=UPI00145EA3E6|nr:hypothetical protein [Acidovorax sp. SRB_24]NMM75555.1 hypothetical protein [Acidovorax sp. SRB_24]NMM85075.1 hypothetical protein [Rhodococcus sp. SRB_17]
MKYARIVENVAAEVWTDGGLDITPADVFVPEIAVHFTPCPDEVRAGWAHVGGQWTAPDAPEPPSQNHGTIITPLAFRRRFTKEERAAIEWAAVDRADQTNEQRMQAAALRSSLEDQRQATYIDLKDDDVIEGVLGMEVLGLLDVGRADEILGAPVQAGELLTT